MSSLRERMTREIVGYPWCDYVYKRHFNETFPKTYSEWLATLDDENFLAAYNRVRDASNDLD